MVANKSHGDGRAWQFVPSPSVEFPPTSLRRPSAPLLKEECHILDATPIAKLGHPFTLDRPGTRSALTTGNDPVDVGKIEFRNRPQHGLNGKKPNSGGHLTKVISPKDVAIALDADTHPKVRRPIKSWCNSGEALGTLR